ncbi:MAG: FtsW/RodA/SpoVE family cell cycle protein [Planctomycetota bacterium]
MPKSRVLNLTRLGWGLAVPVLFLGVVGLACIHATDRSNADQASSSNIGSTPAPAETNWLRRTYQAMGPLTTRQILYFITGVGLMGLVLLPNYQRLGRYAYWAYALTILLLVLLIIDHYFNLPLIPVRNNARRWISLGPLSLQPSEFMKPILIMTLARYLRYRDSYRHWSGLLLPFLLTLLPMGLILRQPDLGTTLMLLPVLFIMLFVAGARLRHLLIIVLLGCASLPLFYFYGMKDYQQQRIQILFKQNVPDEHWHMGPGYQLRQSKVALGSGGVFGEGWGQGVFVELPLLPEEQNDFIFAIIGHQWGLIGCGLVILAYGVIIFLGLEVATVTNDPFGRLLAIGIIVMIVAQALLNISMTVGLAPITGMTLPFVSAGGSSLWANFLALGLLVNVAQRRPMLIANPPFEHRDD